MMTLVGNWWAFVLRGVLAILFGIMAFVSPGMALLTLVMLFGIYAITEGVFNVIAAFRGADEGGREPWWALLLEGGVSIVAGLLTFLMPGLTAIALLYLIAGWVIVRGIMEIAGAIRLRKQIDNEWLLGLAGAASIGLGVILALFPGAGALAMIIWIGAYAVFFGVLMIVLGMRLRKWYRAEDHLHGDRFHTVAPSH